MNPAGLHLRDGRFDTQTRGLLGPSNLHTNVYGTTLTTTRFRITLGIFSDIEFYVRYV